MPLRDALTREACDVFTPELLAGTVSSLEILRDLAREAALLFLEPPALDQRIAGAIGPKLSGLVREPIDLGEHPARQSAGVAEGISDRLRRLLRDEQTVARPARAVASEVGASHEDARGGAKYG